MRRKNIFERGLATWQKRLKYIEKAVALDCPVCDSLDCMQWDERGVSPFAKEHCPIADSPKSCQETREIMKSLSRIRTETFMLVREMERLHKTKEMEKR